MNDNIHVFQVRISKKDFESIKIIAKNDNRSLNNYLETVIKSLIKENEEVININNIKY